MGDDQLSRTLIYPCQESTQHDRIRPGSNSLSDVARVLNATICDNRHAMLTGKMCAIINCCDLWHPDAGDYASRADSSRADTHLDGIDSCLDERLCCLQGDDIARNQLYLFPKTVLYLRHRLDDHMRMGVRGIHHQHIDPFFNPVSYTHLRAHETRHDLVCRLL